MDSLGQAGANGNAHYRGKKSCGELAEEIPPAWMTTTTSGAAYAEPLRRRSRGGELLLSRKSSKQQRQPLRVGGVAVRERRKAHTKKK